MKDALTYIVETVICSGVFVLLYRLLFSARVSYGFSRVYLMVSMIAAAVIPLLAIPVYPARVIEITVPMIATSTAALDARGVALAVREFDWGVAALVLYLVMATVALAVLICQTVCIESYKRDAEHTVEQGCDTYTSPRIRSSFSFLKSIFLVFGLAPDERCEIVAHEKSHIRHHHSADMIVMSIMRAVLWFNPFVWISYRYLVEVHEYEADRDLLDAGYEITRYRQLILKQLLGYNPEITSGFATSLTKKRFIMMTRKKSKYTPLRYAAIVPVAVGMTMLFGFTRADDRYVSPATEQLQDEKYKSFTTSGTRYATMTMGEYLREAGIFDAAGRQKEGTPRIAPILVLFSHDALERAKTIDVDFETYCNSTFAEVKYYAEDVNPDSKNPNGALHFTFTLDNLPSERNQKHSADYIYEWVEQMPTFYGGGIDCFTDWLTDYIDPQTECGSLVISFVVEPDGRLTILEGDRSGCPESTSDAVMEAMAAAPKWTPGRHDGKAVRVLFRQPFKVDCPFIKAEVMPTFAGGGLNTFRKWIFDNLKHPESKPTGMVVAEFIIERDGTLSNITILQSSDPEQQTAVEEVLKKSPRWTPGRQKGKAVRVKYILPVKFEAPAVETVKPKESNLLDKADVNVKPKAEDEPLMQAEVMPRFQGGDMNTFREWVGKEIELLPNKERAYGKLVVSFVIERDGSVSSIEYMQGNKKLYAQVEAVLKQCPKWTPGRQKGETVRVKYILPVKFEAPAVEKLRPIS